MILIGIGANLPGRSGPPERAVVRALARLGEFGIAVVRRSRVYRTAAVGPGGQASYANLVARIETTKPPAALLSVFHQVEREFGRGRGAVWAARPLDIDLLAYHDAILGWEPAAVRRGARAAPPRPMCPVVPHPRLHLRPFVVGPLMDIAPAWHHPVFGETTATLWRRLSRQREGRILGRAAAGNPDCPDCHHNDLRY